ncbi:NADAR family protein [Micromonospora sp. A3M-1-15]|nr:NADAR family protein [Micromonospora sp. A3M-1-15]MCP3785207.1 NADAR family protein [Micromonospora sp. A3M-1-15]
MDRKDAPLRILISGLGEPMYGSPIGPTVTQEQRDEAVDYFRKRDRSIAEWDARVPADGPAQPEQPTLSLNRTHYPNGWPTEPGVAVLQNDFPAAITANGRSYPTVSHAYWALSTSDPDLHDQIAAAPRAYAATKLAEQAPRRDGWPEVRLAVMAALMRAKYLQHPELAQTLLSTGDARMIYTDLDSPYWVAGQHGTNWIGRLLEVIRSELAAAAAGIPVPAPHEGGSSAMP